jgi:hypothetical protein
MKLQHNFIDAQNADTPGETIHRIQIYCSNAN